MNAGRTSTAFAGGGIRLAVACVALLCTIVAVFALNLPELSGRVVDETGEPVVGVSVTARNLGDRKRAERALSESEKRMRAVLITAADAIITIDRTGIMQSANPATEQIFGYTSVAIRFPEAVQT